MPFLDWVNKNQAKTTAEAVPLHLLKQEMTFGEPSENLLIQGDNLLALRALKPFYMGQVKCIFIDPPYNTQSAFEHYDDKLEHSQWLSMMYPRLVLLRDLLADSGSIWVTIDSNEAHYLKVLMDEVFGRSNFVADVIWQKRTSRENRAVMSSAHDTVLIYAKSGPQKWKTIRNLLPANDSGLSNPDNDPRGVWKSIPFTAQGYRENQMYEIISPSGDKHLPPKGRCWGATEREFIRLSNEKLIYFPRNGKGRPRVKQFPENQKGLVPMTLWLAKEVGDNEDAKKESLALFDDVEAFATPKPEQLIRHILTIATNPGDMVLDSYLGSGTTAAVAHKMGRQYVGIEMGDHARSHCLPRLQKVIAGEQGGISHPVNWQGGNGFRFFTLGETAFDQDGRLNPTIAFTTLATFIWHAETDTAGVENFNSPFLGARNGVAYYLLYETGLDEAQRLGSTMLTNAVLQILLERHPHDGPKVIYGDSCRLGSARLSAENITFKQLPYDLKMR